MLVLGWEAPGRSPQAGCIPYTPSCPVLPGGWYLLPVQLRSQKMSEHSPGQGILRWVQKLLASISTSPSLGGVS